MRERERERESARFNNVKRSEALPLEIAALWIEFLKREATH